MYRTLLAARPSATGARLLTAFVLCVLCTVTACTDSVLRPPAPITLDVARSHADSEGVGYLRARAASRAIMPNAAKRSLSSASATVLSVTPGWVQGNLQRQPIVATLSGNVNSVKVSSGQSSGDAILCSGNYGTLIAYDANGATLGSAALTLIDPTDCGSDNVTFGAQATVTVTQGVIASFKILPMSPFEFTVNGVRGGHATATYAAVLGEYPAVDNPPTAVFSAGCDNLTLTCILDASGSSDDVGIVSYTWDLNTSPGGSASGKVVQVTYPAAGPRNITLTVTDTKGQTSSSTMQVPVGTPAGQPPTAFVVSINCGGGPPLTCTFDSSQSWGSTPLVRSWKFGDGATAGDVVVPTHTYSAAGIYPVLLTVTDGYGLSNSAVYPLNLTQAPTAPSSMSLAQNCVGAVCTYSANVSMPNPPVTLAWNFGDATTAGNVTNPTHTFAASGTYGVIVIATDALGGISVGTFVSTVTAPGSDTPPLAAFNWTCVGLNPRQCAVDASGSTDDKGIVSYKWDWGNGRGETKTVPTTKNTWASSGTYQVTLTVTDSKGQTNAITKSVIVP